MIISRTPLRASFAGGGSDIGAYYRNRPPGVVVSTCINRYIYITVNKKFDDLVRVSYSQTELVNSADDVEHNIIREALKLVGIERGIEVVYMADLPLVKAGFGLGSSSSLAVGVLNALYAYKGQHVSAEQLARDACKIEIDILGNPIGKQDQYAAAYGGLNYIQFNSDESVFVDPLIFNQKTKRDLNKKLMLFYTGIERISSDILEEQTRNMPENLEYIDKMVDLANELCKSLRENKIDQVGEILHQGWVYKTKLASGVTSQRIDEYYDRARSAGASGGKILGAGGGGFMLLFCDQQYQNKVREALRDLKENPIDFEQQGSKIIYVQDQ